MAIGLNNLFSDEKPVITKTTPLATSVHSFWNKAKTNAPQQRAIPTVIDMPAELRTPTPMNIAFDGGGL
jgi:hypothetical protein